MLLRACPGRELQGGGDEPCTRARARRRDRQTRILPPRGSVRTPAPSPPMTPPPRRGVSSRLPSWLLHSPARPPPSPPPSRPPCNHALAPRDTSVITACLATTTATSAAFPSSTPWPRHRRRRVRQQRRRRGPVLLGADRGRCPSYHPRLGLSPCFWRTGASWGALHPSPYPRHVPRTCAPGAPPLPLTKTPNPPPSSPHRQPHPTPTPHHSLFPGA